MGAKKLNTRSRRRSRTEVSEAPDIGPHLPDLGGALLHTSETPKPEASRSKVGGGTGVHLLYSFSQVSKKAHHLKRRIIPIPQINEFARSSRDSF